jgi:energy-coupling factor transport system permease protein
VAWWAWALGLAVAASTTTDPLLLLMILGVLAFVVVNRRSDAPWARAFRTYLVLALVVVAVRVVFRTVFAGAMAASSAHVLVTLPRVPLPGWFAGVQLGGPVTLEATTGALYDGLRLGTLLCCIGAANTLANPKRALRALPRALSELGTAVVVTLSVAPQLVESVQRVRRARRLRGGAARGWRSLRSIAIPVLEDALERSLRLAAAMDSRGYGRVGGVPRGRRHATGTLLLAGLLALCLGVYGLLDGSAIGGGTAPAFAVGALCCTAGLVLGGRGVARSRYRPDPWRGPEWAVVALGVLPAVVVGAALGASAAGLAPATDPLVWPTLPWLPAAAVTAAALAGVVAPPPPRRTAASPRRERAAITEGRPGTGPAEAAA